MARALGIPTRIITGYHLGPNGLGMHAWVEASLEKGQWQVIEPQLAEGLTETHTRFYFPLIRGTYFEDMKSDPAELNKAFASFEGQFLQMPAR